MKITIFQKLYNLFRDMKTPDWYLRFTDYVFNNIIKEALTILGEQLLEEIKRLCVQASQKDWTNRQKANWVFDQFRASITLPALTDSMLNLIIEMCVSELKKKGII